MVRAKCAHWRASATETKCSWSLSWQPFILSRSNLNLSTDYRYADVQKKSGIPQKHYFCALWRQEFVNSIKQSFSLMIFCKGGLVSGGRFFFHIVLFWIMEYYFSFSAKIRRSIENTRVPQQPLSDYGEWSKLYWSHEHHVLCTTRYIEN